MSIFKKKSSTPSLGENDSTGPVEKSPPPPELILTKVTPPKEPPAREPAPTEAPSVVTPPPRTAAERNYGIDKAIELMRLLPVSDDNVELTVQIIKKTLESTGVKITSILEDAAQKQTDIRKHINTLQDEVTSFKKEISRRNDEIQVLEKDYQETTLVRERLSLAEKLNQAAAQTTPPVQVNRNPSKETPPLSKPSTPPSRPPSTELDLSSWAKDLTDDDKDLLRGHTKPKDS